MRDLGMMDIELRLQSVTRSGLKALGAVDPPLRWADYSMERNRTAARRLTAGA